MMSSLKISAFGLIILYGPQIGVICAKHYTLRIYAKGTQPHALQKLRNGFTASFSVYFFSETASKKLHAARHTCLALQGKKGRKHQARYLSNAWTYFSRLLTQFKTCAKKSQQFQYSVIQFPVISPLLTCAVNSHLISNIIFFQCYLFLNC